MSASTACTSGSSSMMSTRAARIGGGIVTPVTGSGGAPRAFGREERLEHAAAHVFFHADPGVPDGHHGPLALDTDRHRASPTIRHRIDGVGDQVGEDFPELLGAPRDGWRHAVDAELVAHAAALCLELPAWACQLDDLARNLAEVDALERARAASPRELLDAADRVGTILRRAADGLEVAHGRRLP